MNIRRDWGTRRIGLLTGPEAGKSTACLTTQQAMKGLVDRPEDRADEVRGLFERAGCQLLSYYMTLGDHDYLIISEAPNPTAFSAFWRWRRQAAG